jgi:hypothetical protein
MVGNSWPREGTTESGSVEKASIPGWDSGKGKYLSWWLRNHDILGLGKLRQTGIKIVDFNGNDFKSWQMNEYYTFLCSI